MATRGHVQDPNDRRLRPIYGEYSEPACRPVRQTETYSGQGEGLGGPPGARAVRGGEGAGRAGR